MKIFDTTTDLKKIWYYDILLFCNYDNIILKKYDKALESYYEMLKIGEEPIKIIVLIANQIRLM